MWNGAVAHVLLTSCLDTALGYITKPLDKYVIPFIDRWMGRGENNRDSSSSEISASTSSGSTSSSGAESLTLDNPDPERPKPFFPFRSGRPIKPSLANVSFAYLHLYRMTHKRGAEKDKG